VKELSIAGARKSSMDMGDDYLEAARSWKAAESLESDTEMKYLSRSGSEGFIIGKQEKNTALMNNVTTVYALADDERARERWDTRGGQSTTQITSKGSRGGGRKASRTLGMSPSP
jgi:hypothetical protein